MSSVRPSGCLAVWLGWLADRPSCLSALQNVTENVQRVWLAEAATAAAPVVVGCVLGYIYGLVSFSVICALVLGLFGVFRCLRATTTTTATRATAEALTLPIQFLTDDLAPLNADLNHLPVPPCRVHHAINSKSKTCGGFKQTPWSISNVQSPEKIRLRSGNVRGQWTAGSPSSALGWERE
uniref:Uncharacterized protein n=1 Tax=Anopheles farauti TaxID=69004 RepID=A0A182QV54_9DIPT